jgi:hypothetical protein
LLVLEFGGASRERERGRALFFPRQRTLKTRREKKTQSSPTTNHHNNHNNKQTNTNNPPNPNPTQPNKTQQALYKLPHIFVVENNKWAIGMNHPRATAPTEGDNEPFIYKKGAAFGMPGVLVDGMDVLKVRASFPLSRIAPGVSFWHC